ncbi:MAG: YciI family protein [Bacteroidota bacterium]
MIAIHSVYLKPLEEVDKYLPGHRAFLKTLYDKGITICSGPQIPRTGGFILMNAATRAEAMEIMKDDPYALNKVAEYSFIEFDLKSFAPGFEKFTQGH